MFLHALFSHFVLNKELSLLKFFRSTKRLIYVHCQPILKCFLPISFVHMLLNTKTASVILVAALMTFQSSTVIRSSI